jgi:hypothetical protein
VEDPTEFDVWGAMTRDCGEKARELLHTTRPTMTRFELLQATAVAGAHTRLQLLIERVGWAAAQSWAKKLEGPFSAIRIVAHGEQPGWSKAQHCETHALQYGGCLGCPVCRGFFLA